MGVSKGSASAAQPEIVSVGFGAEAIADLELIQCLNFPILPPGVACFVKAHRAYAMPAESDKLGVICRWRNADARF